MIICIRMMNGIWRISIIWGIGMRGGKEVAEADYYAGTIAR